MIYKISKERSLQVYTGSNEIVEYKKKEYWMNEGISKEFRVIAISSYLEARRQEWCNQSDTEQVIVRAAYILTAMLNVQNVVDVANVTINGETDRITLATDEVPTLGAVTLTEG